MIIISHRQLFYVLFCFLFLFSRIQWDHLSSVHAPRMNNIIVSVCEPLARCLQKSHNISKYCCQCRSSDWMELIFFFLWLGYLSLRKSIRLDNIGNFFLCRRESDPEIFLMRKKIEIIHANERTRLFFFNSNLNEVKNVDSADTFGRCNCTGGWSNGKKLELVPTCENR